MIEAGMKQDVLRSNTPWYCVSCYYCVVRCPQDVHITDLMYTLKRMAIMSTDRNGGIRLELKQNQLRITSDNPDLGEAQEDLDVEYDGEDLAIGFNARYFIDILNEMHTDKVVLEFNGELDPGLVRPTEAGYVGVVMPLRI